MPKRKTAQEKDRPKVHVRRREDDRSVSYPRHGGQGSNQSCLERSRQLTSTWRHLLTSDFAVETLMDRWHIVHLFARPSRRVNGRGPGQPWSWIHPLLEGCPKVGFSQHEPQSLGTPCLQVHGSQRCLCCPRSTESTLRTILQTVLTLYSITVPSFQCSSSTVAGR